MIDTSFTDNNAMLNALLSGQLNLLVGPALQQVAQQVASPQVQILQSSTASNTYSFGMRVDEGPFADNRVRQAFKLMTDRQALVNGALAGFGSPGNDLQAPNTEYFAADLKSPFDVEKAKSTVQGRGRRRYHVRAAGRERAAGHGRVGHDLGRAGRRPPASTSS